MAKLLTHRKLLLAKIESTYNVDPTPTGADDAVLVENLSWSSAGLKMNDRPAVRPSGGTLQHIYGGRLLQVSFEAEVKGSGSAGTAPDLGPLLRACGLGETIVASTSVTYAPVSTGKESCTLYLHEDGKRIIVTGCRGNVSFSMTAGGIVKATFTMTGHEAAQTDTALATPTYDGTDPVAFVGGSFSVGGTSLVIATLDFDLGNTVATPESVNGSDGYDEIEITGRDVNGNIDPLDELVATEDFLGIFKAGTTAALASGTIGATAGNRLAVSMPALYYRDASSADRDGLAGMALPFGAAESTTDDEVSIAFT